MFINPQVTKKLNMKLNYIQPGFSEIYIFLKKEKSFFIRNTTTLLLMSVQ